MPIPVGLRFAIAKTDESQNLVFGYANVSVAKGENGGHLITDLQDDRVSPAELEATAYAFMLDGDGADVNHKGPIVGKCVESMVFTPDKLEKLATDPLTGVVNKAHLDALTAALPPRWWIGFQVEPAVMKRVKSGELTMFSIAGEADREAAA